LRGKSLYHNQYFTLLLIQKQDYSGEF